MRGKLTSGTVKPVRDGFPFRSIGRTLDGNPLDIAMIEFV